MRGARGARAAGQRRRPAARSRRGSSSGPGRALARPTDGLTHLFPSPAALAGADLVGPRADVRPGPRARRRSRGAVADGRLDLRGARGRGRRRRSSRCRASATGRRSTSRCARSASRTRSRPPTSSCARPPAADGRPLTARALAARAEAWRPWRGYAVFHLWGAAAASPGRASRRHDRRVTMRYDEIESPVGPLLVAADDAGLRLIHFQSGPAPRRPDPAWRRDASAVPRARPPARRVLRPASAARSTSRSRPRAPPFQLATWRALRRRSPTAPRSPTPSSPRRVGRPAASRAVGAANGAEPAPDRRALPPGHRQGRLAHRASAAGSPPSARCSSSRARRAWRPRGQLGLL